MKKIFLLLLAPLFIFAKVHYAKVEPYESVTLKSAVSGLVMEVDLEAEGTMVTSKRVIRLDDALDKISLKDTIKSIKLLEEMLSINQNILKGLNGTLKRKQDYYRRISGLSTASKTQKDNAYSSFISAKTQYLNTKEKIATLKKQILDMKYKAAMLEDTVSKKSIVLHDKYLYKLMVKKGDFVAPGKSLARIDDIGKAKLVLFLDPDELENVQNRTVYIDGKKTDYKVNKVWRVADEKYISSYRAEIYILAPKGTFSKLLKVEIK